MHLIIFKEKTKENRRTAMISLTKISNKPHRGVTEEFIPPTYKLENVLGRRGISQRYIPV